MDVKTLQHKFDASLTDLPSLGMDVHSMVEDFRRYYTHTLGRDRHSRSSHYAYQALVLSLRDRLMERWKNTRYAYEAADARHAYYLSLEFLWDAPWVTPP
jgi:starch phosphorylase